jgi:NAD(P)-dependent dehydrogenase (short-subunit alcohol dehydrogenase family)
VEGRMEDRTIVVTGGGSGIGKATALLCAEKLGARLAVLDVNEAAARDVAEEALSSGAPRALGVECDVTRESEVEKAFELCTAQLGAPDGLFANAGIDIGGLEHELSYETWDRVLSTNLSGVFLTCKHALRAMLEAGKGGSIVCTSSPSASVALAAGGTGAYSASKGGVSALVRCLAIDYARNGIRVNAVVPGATETPLMWANVAEDEREQMREQINDEVPLGRLADPAEIGHAVLWLLSDASAYVTGSHLVCDGGILAKGSISV